MARYLDRDPKKVARLARLAKARGIRLTTPPPATLALPSVGDNVEALATRAGFEAFAAAARSAADNLTAEERRMRWHTRFSRWRQHHLSRGARPLVVQYVPPEWMSYLLWYSRHTQAWILELQLSHRLVLIDSHPGLARSDIHAAQSWAYNRHIKNPHDEQVYAWLQVTVTRRRGWAAIHDKDWRTNSFYHDLHPARVAELCCTFPGPPDLDSEERLRQSAP